MWMAPNESSNGDDAAAGAAAAVSECVDLLSGEPTRGGGLPRVIKLNHYSDAINTSKHKTHAVSTTKQVCAALFASLSSVSIGFITAWSSLTLSQLEPNSTHGIDGFDYARDSGLLASMPSISSIAGSLAGGFIMDAIGPRMTLLVTALPCLCSWAFVSFAKSMAVLYVGRFITGIFLGIFSPVPQVYATEIAEPRIRGLMGAFPESAVALGSMLCYVFGTVVDWRWLSIISALLPGIPLFISMVILPESPQWLIKKGRIEDAEKSLRFFREKTHDVKGEIQSIDEDIKKADGSEISIKEQIMLFKKRENWMPVLVVFLVFMCGQFSGFAVVVAFTGEIFEKANTGIDTNTATIIVGAVRFFATLVSAVLLDHTGRRPLLIISAIGSSVGMVCIGVYFYIDSTGSVESLGWLPLTSLLIYVFFNELGYGPIPWLLSGELIPLAVRTLGNGIAVTAYSLFAFIVSLTFPLLTDLMEDYYVFWMYGVFSLSGVFLGYYLPETRGKTLEEIGHFFASKKNKENDYIAPKSIESNENNI